MADLRVRVFDSPAAFETFLRGGLRLFTLKEDGAKVPIVHNSTLIFTAPAGTVTFNSPQNSLSIKEILDQINAVLTTNAKAKLQNRNLVIEGTTVGVVVASTGTANPVFGLSATVATTGLKYGAAVGTPPALVSFAVDKNVITAVVVEV